MSRYVIIFLDWKVAEGQMNRKGEIMSEKVEIVGVMIDRVTMSEAVRKLSGFLQGERCNMVFTPNSEILMDAVKDRELEDILNKGQLVVPDGIGVVIASKFYGTPLEERVAGFDLMSRLFVLADERKSKIFMLGGKEGVAQEAAEKLKLRFPGLEVVGIRNGYFDSGDEAAIIDEINKSGADILLAALGAPKQEKFIFRHHDALKVKIAMGVGGSLDVLAGRAQRAPDFYQKAGLEWFYRLIKEPWRLGRMMRLPKFIILAFYDAKTK